MRFTGGRYYDQLVFGMTREEFEQHHSAPADSNSPANP